jgi:hypothetical protein
MNGINKLINPSNLSMPFTGISVSKVTTAKKSTAYTGIELLKSCHNIFFDI